MLRTAWFTFTEPRLPPMTRMIGLAAERWVYWRPARRSPFSSSARIGDPGSCSRPFLLRECRAYWQDPESYRIRG